MKDKKVLYVSSEVLPYSPYSELAKMSFEAPRMVNNNGGQIRIFMPKFGNINERRHQLHEVIRLSGMNIIINDIDVPLIIKVASLRSAYRFILLTTMNISGALAHSLMGKTICTQTTMSVVFSLLKVL